MLAGACGAADEPAPAPARPAASDVGLVDERAGTVDGVRLGDGPGRMRRRFGPPVAGSPTRPTSQKGLPWIIPPPPGEGRARSVSFPGRLALVRGATGAYALSIWERGARTRAGVGLGDPLSLARERYGELDCGVRNEGTEYVPYPYCRARIAGHWIWFGQDPIASITLTSTRPS